MKRKGYWALFESEKNLVELEIWNPFRQRFLTVGFQLGGTDHHIALGFIRLGWWRFNRGL